MTVPLADATAEDIKTRAIFHDVGGPVPPANLLGLLTKSPPPLLVEVTHSDGTKTFEPEKPLASDLLRHVRFANPRAKAKVARAHLHGTAQRFARRFHGGRTDAA